MSTPLSRFLASIATDIAFYQKYLEDPDATMREAGLSDADQAALRSRNVQELTDRLCCGPGSSPQLHQTLMNGGYPFFGMPQHYGQSPLPPVMPPPFGSYPVGFQAFCVPVVYVMICPACVVLPCAPCVPPFHGTGAQSCCKPPAPSPPPKPSPGSPEGDASPSG